ncbi:MAG: hypothetical protein IJ180_02530 [Bacteroidales bacterium]|nr:hypothetical protein [Bacteroidales bacterium]
MKRIFYPIICFCIIVLFGACTVLRTPVVIKNEPVDNYKYVYITPTKDLTSSSAIYTSYGYSVSKSVNPQDVIAGILIKKGYIVLPELDTSVAEETLVVNYGESGTRSTGLGGYTIEVTIQFISAKTHKLVCSCTAEGQGSTEADDIREAITRALSNF